MKWMFFAACALICGAACALVTSLPLIRAMLAAVREFT